ncbi:TonB-dependent receptor [Sinimarinibacterium sp. NLF-5-8]|uniref:TonB-dependent receptor family protein n=1 Tax=Sinimarinibacterium sp. NLF-5-8 TaxID=2698684 RepID=UPI00137B9DFC|nr:TonB-dependent receptor [Sinimarinibacterium sp. NLF-5-8]QHS10577.1 TonB-dependent receptor [Sinimarinibacterium sp. NLF-5-8]
MKQHTLNTFVTTVAALAAAPTLALAQSTAPTLLNPIEVHASVSADPVLQTQRLTPGQLQVVDGETFNQRQVTTLSDALRYVPGVMLQSSGANEGGQTLSIRGSNLTAQAFASGGVIFYQDGLPVSAADGSNHNRFLDPLSARDIVVANGASALTYGASALGGAINVVSRTARNSDPNQLYLSGGSYGLFDGFVSTGGVRDNLDAMLSVEHKHDDGFRARGQSQRSNIQGNFGWQASPGFNLRVFATHIHNDQQLAGALTRDEFNQDPRQVDPSAVLGNHMLNVSSDRLATVGDWMIDANRRLEFGLSFETQSLYHPIVTTPFFSLLIDTRQNTSGGMLRYHQQIGSHHLLLGTNISYTLNAGSQYANSAGARGDKSNDVRQSAADTTLFILDRWQLARAWTLVYGGQGIITRRDMRKTAVANGNLRQQDKTYSAFNPRIGVLYALTAQQQLFANISRVYQAPDFFMLDNDARGDNSVLSAMRGISYEIGARGHAQWADDIGSQHWSLTLYHSRLNDEVLSVENPARPGTMLTANYAHSRHSGVEALYGASLALAGGAHRIEPLISATFNDLRLTDDPTFGNNRLPSAPRYFAHGEVLYRHMPSGLYAGPTFDWVGSRYADMTNTYRVDHGYTLIGLRMGVQAQRWTLFAEASNLGDRRYVASTAIRTQASDSDRLLTPGAPRSVFVGLRWNY